MPTKSPPVEQASPDEWVSARRFDAYVRRVKGQVQSFDSWGQAAKHAAKHGGTAWTVHHADEGDSTFYQRGPGFVNVLNFCSVVPKKMRPTDDDPSTWRLIKDRIGPHGTFSLWLIDESDDPASSILEVRGDDKRRIAGTAWELGDLARALLEVHGTEPEGQENQNAPAPEE